MLAYSKYISKYVAILMGSLLLPADRLFVELYAFQLFGRSKTSNPTFRGYLMLTTYFVGLHALGSLFLLLLPNDDEGAAKFVECETHMYCCGIC
jgi:hypothetical protein